MIIRYFDDPDYPEVFVDIHLVKKSLWYRIKYGIKYIFGYKCKYGAWDEMIMNKDHIKPLESVVAHIKKVEAGHVQPKLFNDGDKVNN